MGWKFKTNAGKMHEKSKQSGNQFKPEVCKKRMSGKPCNYCNQVAKLRASEDEDDKTIAGKTFAKATYYMNVIPLLDGGKKVEPKNFIMPSGIQNWRDLIANLPDEDGDGVDFTDPDKAFAILLTRKGKGRNTKYTLRVSQKPQEIPVKFLKKMFQLHKALDYIDDDNNVWVPSEGKNKFLVLPPWGPEAEGNFYSEIFYHWNTELLGAAEGEDDEFGDDSDGDGDETFDDSGSDDEGFADEFDDDAGDSSHDDEFGDDSGDDDAPDDFEDDDAESEPSLDDMDKKAMIKYATSKGLKLSDKAKKAPDAKLRAYLKKKLDDVPF